MAAKNSASLQGKKSTKRAMAGTVESAKPAAVSVEQGLMRLKKTNEREGEHAHTVELICETVDMPFIRNKKFKAEGDDRGAFNSAFRFVVSTDELTAFRAFVLEEEFDFGKRSGACASASAIDGKESVSRGVSEDGKEQFLSRPHDRIESAEPCERRSVSFICIRQNPRTGLRLAVVMTQIEGDQHRMISFLPLRQGYGTQEHESRSVDELLLSKAVGFLRSTTFEQWRKDSADRVSYQGDQFSAHLRHRALKHPWSYVGIEGGEKVDCQCGKNRSKGLMVACEQCGVWEHADCLGYRSKSQIPVDYSCSACVRAQKEEVIFLRLDEQVSSGNIFCKHHLDQNF